MLNTYHNLICQHVRSPLSSVPFHKDIPFIERFFSEEFPMHMAIHKVTAADGIPCEYTEPHTHNVDEINILVGNEGELEYAIQLGEGIFNVQSNTSIWIPAGLQHASNVIRGSGYFIAIRLNDTSLTLKAFSNVLTRQEENSILKIQSGYVKEYAHELAVPKEIAVKAMQKRDDIILLSPTITEINSNT